MFDSYDSKSYVYMDLTYGTKATSIEMFSSLCYAEIVKQCNIKSVIYGKYSFNDSGYGELFNITSLYHTVRFLETAAQMDKKAFNDLIEQVLKIEGK